MDDEVYINTTNSPRILHPQKKTQLTSSFSSIFRTNHYTLETLHFDLHLTIMRSILFGMLALVASVSALPAPEPELEARGNPCGLVGACPTLGEMKCCGTGFVTCDYSGWVYRECGPGTVCHQLPAPGPLFCGYPPRF